MSNNDLSGPPIDRNREGGSLPAITLHSALITLFRLVPDAFATGAIPKFPNISDFAPAIGRCSRYGGRATSTTCASPHVMPSRPPAQSVRTNQSGTSDAQRL